MSADSEFEKSFKKINNISSEVPDKMWASIQSKLERKRRFIIFFFASILSSVLIISFFLIQFNNNNKKILRTVNNKVSTPGSVKILNNNPAKRQSKLTINNYYNKDLITNKSKIKKTIASHKIAINSGQNKIEDYASKPIDELNTTNANEIKSDSINQQNLSDNALKPKPKNKQQSISSFNDDNNKEDKNDDNDALSVSIFISPDLPFQKTYFTDTLGFKSTLKSAMHLSFTFGARVSYDFNKHFSGSLGVQYAQANDRIKTATILVAHYKTLDFPLLAGYNFSFKNFNAGINAGIIVNIKASKTSNITSTSAYPYYFQKDDSYEKHTGISYYAGLNLTFYQHKQLSFFAEPYFKYRPSNIATSFAQFQQKINTAGIMLGAKYNFSKKNNPSSTLP